MRRYYCLILLVVAMISSCASNSNIIENLDRAAEIMNEKPDSAKIVLDGIKRSELKNRALKARFALLYSQAMDKCYIDTDNDSLISVALKYYSKHGTDHEKALAYYYHSVVFRNRDDDIEAEVNALLEAKKYTATTEDHFLNGLIYHALARLYSAQGQHEEAFELYDKGSNEFKIVGHRANEMGGYMGASRSLAALSRNNESKDYAIKAYEIAKELNLVEHIVRLGAKISILNRELYDYKANEYIHFIRENKNLFGDDLDRLYGILYEFSNQIDSAKYYYKKFTDSTRPHSKISVNILSIVAELAEELGDYKEAFEYKKQYSKAIDSIHNAEKSVIIQSLEQKYKTQQAEAAYKKLQERYRMTTIIYALLGVIAAISAAWAISRHKRRNAQRLAEYQEYIEQADLQRNKLQEKFHNIQQQIEQQNLIKDEQRTRLLEVLKNRIESLRQLSELASVYGVGDNSRFYGKFQEHIQLSKNKNQELMNDIIEVADLLHNGVISFLRENNSSLTKHELCYCGFIALGFSPESIRVLYNHTNINSIYTTRGKIRSKLSLNAAYRDLEAYILELSEKLGEKKDAQQG